MRAIGGVCAVLCTAAALPAAAQGLTGLYIRGDVGWTKATDADIHDKNFALDGGIFGNSSNTIPGTLNDIGSGWLAGAGIGSQIAPAFRADVVYTYRGGYDLSDTDQGTPLTAFGANVSSHSVMANVYWDIPLPVVAPFIGGGVGWARNKMSDVNATTSGTTVFLPSGDRDNFAWQLMAGVAFGFAGPAKLELFYRYFDGGDIESGAGNVTQGGSVVGTYSGMKGNLRAHELVASIRFPIGP